MLPLNDDELALVTGAVDNTNVRELVEKIRDYITQGHYSQKNAWNAYGQSIVR